MPINESLDSLRGCSNTPQTQAKLAQLRFDIFEKLRALQTTSASNSEQLQNHTILKAQQSEKSEQLSRKTSLVENLTREVEQVSSDSLIRAHRVGESKEALEKSIKETYDTRKQLAIELETTALEVRQMRSREDLVSEVVTGQHKHLRDLFIDLYRTSARLKAYSGKILRTPLNESDLPFLTSELDAEAPVAADYIPPKSQNFKEKERAKAAEKRQEKEKERKRDLERERERYKPDIIRDAPRKEDSKYRSRDQDSRVHKADTGRKDKFGGKYASGDRRKDRFHRRYRR